MPWDAPDRFMGWGYFPTPWPNWAVAGMLEMGQGFPFSVQHDDGAVEGAVNSYRLPSIFSLDLHLERRFHMGKHRVALRGGFTNITNHRSPTVVNNTIGAPQFMQYFGTPGRHAIFRLRWIGRDIDGRLQALTLKTSGCRTYNPIDRVRACRSLP